MKSLKNTLGWGTSTSKSSAHADAADSSSKISSLRSGFLGSLNEEQLIILNQFKARNVSLMPDELLVNCPVYFTEAEEIKLQTVKNKKVSFTETDAFLLRFLRARQFGLENAQMMLRSYLEWRGEFRVKEIAEVVRFPWIHQLRSFYPHGYHGVDKQGRPIYIERVGKAQIDLVLKLASLNYLLSYWVQQYEYLLQVILPACSIAAGRRIEHSISILDLSGLGFSHVGSQSRSTMKQLAQLSQNYYPEMLGAMVIINAPTIFGPLWSFSKSLLDEVTVSKIMLFTSRSNRWRDVLKDLIDADQLPVFLGGSAPDEGPWTELEILHKVQQRNPNLNPSLVYLDISKGDKQSLQLLDNDRALPQLSMSNTPDDKTEAILIDDENLEEIEKAFETSPFQNIAAADPFVSANFGNRDISHVEKLDGPNEILS